ncbi:SigB/SigF/SigG family RNA polymerase sigma factor [Nocardiopsis sp. NPDC006139]|uniref:SigB/SigF/SigG family RNA polymerase sigma factor n=1 Tax=Nocardiopsis sp. NPDC006139 TaxID=3154578 RepID=UPI0033BDB922
MVPPAAHATPTPTPTPTATAPVQVPRPRRPVDSHGFEEGSAEDILARLHALAPDAPQARELWERLLEEFVPLVSRIARDYRGRGEPLEDVTQAAMVGLVKAVRGFDPGRGTPFLAYLRPTVTGEIKRHFRDHTWAVRVARCHQENRIRLRRVSEDFEQEHGRRPTTAELAGLLGLSDEEVRRLLQASEAYQCLSLDRTEPDDEGEEAGTRLEDRLGDEETGYELVLERESLKPVLAGLDDRGRALLRLRFFDDLTQAQIAEHLGCSQMHVSRLLREVLDLVRDRLGESDRPPG